MRIDTFDYKNNIFHATYKVFQMTGEIEATFSKINPYDKRMDQLYQLFDIMRNVLGIDVNETLWLFKQAEYILPPNIYDSVKEIANDFNELTGDFGKFELYPKILTANEIEVEKERLLGDIMDRARQINKHVAFIDSIMPREIDIRTLEN